MPRSRCRAIKRARRLKAALEEAAAHPDTIDVPSREQLAMAVRQARTADENGAKILSGSREDGELARLVRHIERTDGCVWAVARAVKCTPDETMMLAQIVNPKLAAMSRAEGRLRRAKE
jgi:hypothetical protein